MNSYEMAAQIKKMDKDFYASKNSEAVLEEYKRLAVHAAIERLNNTYNQGWTYLDYARVNSALNDRLAAMEGVLLERGVEFEKTTKRF